MAYVKEIQPGLIDGDLLAGATLTPGQFCSLNGTDKTVIATAAATGNPLGLVLEKQAIGKSSNVYASGDKVAVAYHGGIYETDNFTATSLVSGSELMFPDGAGKIGLRTAGGARNMVGTVIDVSATVLRFKLDIQGVRT